MHACMHYAYWCYTCMFKFRGWGQGGGGGEERYPGISTKIEGFQSINLSMQGSALSGLANMYAPSSIGSNCPSISGTVPKD